MIKNVVNAKKLFSTEYLIAVKNKEINLRRKKAYFAKKEIVNT